MAITAAQVKELRERTGAGMMECKKALVEADGGIDAAIENMRKSGAARADKKADRVAAEGLLCVQTSDDSRRAAIVEVNCETDFVARGDDFQDFVTAVAKVALARQTADIDSLLNAVMDDGLSVAKSCKNLIARIGENMNVRRVQLVENSNGIVASYLHGGRIGVVVSINGGDETLARDIAMHVAATNPQAISADAVDPALIEKERDIFTAQAKESGKPDKIIEKMITGRIARFLKETTLLGQPFVKDPGQTVEALLKTQDATVISFTRFEVGEGIEKREESFADEVMGQIKG